MTLRSDANGLVKYQIGKSIDVVGGSVWLISLHLFCVFSEDWYKDRLTDAQLDELENPKPKTTKGPATPIRRKQSSRRQPPAVKVQAEEDAE